jgi:SAM-dependent methyltransferase
MSSRLQRLAGAPRRAAVLLASGTERLQQLLDLVRRSLKISEDTARLSSAVDKKVASLDKDVRALHGEMRSLRAEVHDRMLQYHLQLGRLSRGSSNRIAEPRLSGRTVPLAIDQLQRLGWDGVGSRPAPDPEGREWLLLESCAVCGSADRTIVNEFNKIILLKKAPDETSARYDYAICHACGILYATRRPFGGRYRFLLENFGEVTAKTGGGREIANPLLNPYSLSEADKEHLRKIAARGVFVSDHLGLRSTEYLDGLLKDRFENSVHLDLLGTLLAPRGARVLEIRPRTGMISDGLRRLFGCEVHALPIWESQQFLLKEVYGIESAGLVDFDRFEIPYVGQFDLIVANHILTHLIRPAEFFAVVRRRLAPGGHIYLYNEGDDAEFLSGKQSMLATLNPLHMQSFDSKSLRRGLAASGFEVVFQRRRQVNHMCLARLSEPRWTPMSESDRAARIKAYRRARDRAILGVREELRPRFAEEWSQIVERGVSEGIVEFDANGRLRLVAD